MGRCVEKRGHRPTRLIEYVKKEECVAAGPLCGCVNARVEAFETL